MHKNKNTNTHLRIFILDFFCIPLLFLCISPLHENRTVSLSSLCDSSIVTSRFAQKYDSFSRVWTRLWALRVPQRQRVAVCGSMLQCAAVCCRVLQCVALCYSSFSRVWTRLWALRILIGSVLQCATVCRSVLQCVAVCYSVLQCVAVCYSSFFRVWTSLSALRVPQRQRVAVCCSVLKCVAVCCSVLQCVAVCCSMLQCDAVWCSLLLSLL